MKVVDKFRIEVLSRLSEIPSLRDSWSQFSSSIDAIVGSNPNANQIFLLGFFNQTLIQAGLNHRFLEVVLLGNVL